MKGIMSRKSCSNSSCNVLIPQWLEILLGEDSKFFNPCEIHENTKKNEKNIFCLDCCTTICTHCLLSHPPHDHIIQIRRYVYNDVIRMSDAQKLINCSFVQPYTTNSARVLFLKQRPISRPFRGSGKFCVTCDRSLQDPFLFCSLSCKVHYVVRIQKQFDGKEFLQLESETKSENLTECELVHDSSGSPSGSTSSEITQALKCSSTNPHELVWKKQSGSTNSVQQDLSEPRSSSQAVEVSDVVNRRKCVPRRSPMY